MTEKKKTILVVDDEPVIRDLCSKALKGYTVLQAGSGDEAIRHFEKGGIDVILTDVMMPRMNGLSLLRRVKEMEPTLVVIIMTGFAEKEVILDALRQDADDFITKPINLLQLKTVVEKALIKRALKEEIVALRNLDRLKTNFLSLISHKFRTPLTVISLFMQNLESRQKSGNEDPEFLATVRMAHDETLYLERLVADLLVFSKLMDDGSPLRLQPCDVESIIFRAVSQTRKAIRKQGIEVEVEVEPLSPFMLDLEKISFAIRQVVENAFKFSGEPGRVSLSVRKTESDLFITVADTGIGIAKKEIPKIFEKFYQIDQEQAGQVPGFGLGLFYAREFVKQHGGSISVASTPGEGTTVTIEVPIRQQPPV